MWIFRSSSSSFHYEVLELTLGVATVQRGYADSRIGQGLPRSDGPGWETCRLRPYLKQEEEAIEIEEIIREPRRLFTDAGIPVYDDVKTPSASSNRL